MINKKQKIILMENIQTSLQSHDNLAYFSSQILNFDGTELILDFKDVTFISANHYATLGCILATFQSRHPDTQILMRGVSEKIISVMQVNGFGKNFSLPQKPDRYNTAIPYRVFSVNEISEFEKYITINIFSRNDIPKMSDGVRERMIDNILEIFNNVKEHASCSELYTCGQFFPRRAMLYFTIVDSGETIAANVLSHLSEYEILLETTAIEWAMQPGNSTRKNNGPGGLGLYLLSDFIALNKGELYIISSKESYEQKERSRRYKYLRNSFPGTIVTMAFNLNDKYSYCLAGEQSYDFDF